MRIEPRVPLSSLAMSDSALPHSVRFLPDESGWQRFEFSSRGDRVTVRVSVPESAEPLPVAVVLADEVATVTPLMDCATLSFDLPLLGARSSPKWTERLTRCLAEGPVGAADDALLGEFVNQAATDVSAALDVCAGLPGVAAPAGLIGRGAGSLVAARLHATEPRLSHFVLAREGLAEELDPAAALEGDPACTLAGDAAEAAARLGDRLR